MVRKEPSEWKHLGQAGVDSGSMLLIDPCYILKGKPYDEVINAWKATNWGRTLEYKGGFLTSTGFGDGGYDVFAKITDYGQLGKRVSEIRIVFMDTHDETTTDKLMEMVPE